MLTLREQLDGKCKYFTGCHPIEISVCKKGHVYADIAKLNELGRTGCICRLPCTGRRAGSVECGNTVQSCDDYTPLSKKEIKDEIDNIDRCIKLTKKRLSTCCEAQIDESQVIKKGRYKGHGPCFCTKCGKVVYWV